MKKPGKEHMKLRQMREMVKWDVVKLNSPLKLVGCPQSQIKT